MFRTVIRYMCPLCFRTVLGDVDDSFHCPCGEKMGAVSASVLESRQAEWLLRRERVFERRIMKELACAGSRGGI
ncbi:MAG: hypothetical protein H5T99_09215 [Moorella sp. (in: Bacteria)]|nr:hypothetical protein [Moorella sp. (in: firmicutes)]